MKLRPFEIRWAAIVGRALLPQGILGGVVDDVDLGEALRRECAEPPWYAALLLRASLWMTWLAPPFALRRWRTFGGLDAQGREAVLEKLLDSPVYVVRATATFLKLASCMLLMGNQRVLQRIGAYEYGRRRADAATADTTATTATTTTSRAGGAS